MYDYSKLRGRIVEKCGTLENFSKALGISQHTMTSKIQQRVWFKQNEIEKAIDVLELSADDIQVYFFTAKVQN